MANFVGNLTAKGFSLLSKIIVGKTKLEITRIVVGEGKLGEGQTGFNLGGVIIPVNTDVKIRSYDANKDGVMTMKIRIESCDTEFDCREIGVMAKDTDGKEILYQYFNCGDDAIHFRKKDSNLFYYDVTLITVMGTEGNVTVDVSADVEVSAVDFDELKTKLDDNLVYDGYRNLNQFYTIHDIMNYEGSNPCVQEAYFVHKLTEEEIENGYVGVHTLYNEAGYTGNPNNMAMLSLSVFGSICGMCIVEMYGKYYLKDADIYFEDITSSGEERVDTIYGTIRIITGINL